MEITEERRMNMLILRVMGKLDASTARDLEGKFLDLAAAGQVDLVVDLAQLDYVSSAGLHVFHLAAKRMAEAKGNIILCAPKPTVKQVFDITGFSSILNFAASIEDAIRLASG